MVFGAYEKYIGGPRRRAIARAEQVEKERDEAKAKQAEARTERNAGNERRLQAEARGEPFDEPFPGVVAETK